MASSSIPALATPLSSFSERPTTPWMHREAIVNGIRMHYVQADPIRRVRSPLAWLDGGTTTSASSGGDNPRSQPPLVVLLHGFPEFYFSWRHQIGDFVAAGHRVVAPDLRGYNLTEKPNGGYTLNTLSDDVRHFILHLTRPRSFHRNQHSSSRNVASRQSDDDTSRSTSLTAPSAGDTEFLPPPAVDDAEEEHSTPDTEVYLVGHDWGGVIAGAVAARFPRLISKLVLLQAPHLPALELARFHGKAAVPRHRLASIGTLMTYCPPVLPEFVLGFHRAWALSGLFFRSSPVASQHCCASLEATELEEELYRDAMSQPGSVACMLAYFRQFHVSSLQSRRYGKLQCPVLLLWGGGGGGGVSNEDQALATAHAHADCLRDVCTESVQLHIIEQCRGYWIHQEQPEQVNRVVLHFFSASAVDG